jgi:hypothetical protein
VKHRRAEDPTAVETVPFPYSCSGFRGK